MRSWSSARSSARTLARDQQVVLAGGDVQGLVTLIYLAALLLAVGVVTLGIGLLQA